MLLYEILTISIEYPTTTTTTTTTTNVGLYHQLEKLPLFIYKISHLLGRKWLRQCHLAIYKTATAMALYMYIYNCICALDQQVHTPRAQLSNKHVMLQ